jgi:SOS-response transcriptional repressor LexA
MLHPESNSRIFPIRQLLNVGNNRLGVGNASSDNSAMAKDELRQRVTSRLNELGIGAIEAAVSVPGLERNFISDFIKGRKNSFSQAKQPLVAKALKWSVVELNGAETRTHERIGPKITMVPLLDSVAAGRLKSPMSQIPVEDVPLLAFADLGRGEFFALRVEGDSMDRYSPEGSTIVVNKADRQLINGRCYVFAVRGQTTYKLWQGGDIPHLAPHSTNPLNKPIFFKKKSDLEVIGRVKRTLFDL